MRHSHLSEVPHALVLPNAVAPVLPCPQIPCFRGHISYFRPQFKVQFPVLDLLKGQTPCSRPEFSCFRIQGLDLPNAVAPVLPCPQIACFRGLGFRSRQVVSFSLLMHLDVQPASRFTLNVNQLIFSISKRSGCRPSMPANFLGGPGVGFRVQGLRSWIRRLGFEVWGLGIGILGLRFEVLGSGYSVFGLGSGVWGLGI